MEVLDLKQSWDRDLLWGDSEIRACPVNMASTDRMDLPKSWEIPWPYPQYLGDRSFEQLQQYYIRCDHELYEVMKEATNSDHKTKLKGIIGFWEAERNTVQESWEERVRQEADKETWRKRPQFIWQMRENVTV